MGGWWEVLALAAGLPVLLAWQGCRGWTLRQALLWAWGAWSAWVLAGSLPVLGVEESRLASWLALCLTACTGVAVLGARKPGAGVWHFVVFGLLAALLRPVLEGLGELRLEAAHLVFLGVVLLVGVVNYLPTRMGPAVLALGVGCGLELAGLGGVALPREAVLAGRWLLVGSPWLGLLLLTRKTVSATLFDEVWLSFRDRYGLVWGQRSREQFNRSAANAGWPLVLGWSGLVRTGGEPPDPVRVLAVSRAVLKRFEE
jgi:hypothetical protein